MKAFEIILRVLGVAAALGGMALFLLPMTVRVINVGNVLGALLCVWLFCMSFKPLQGLLSGLKRYAVTGFLYRAVNIICVGILIYGAIATAAIVIAANAKPVESSTLVTLGAQVKPGGQPSRILMGRITAAEKYLEANPGIRCVLSGGKGEKEGVSEARCMYNVMTSDGISGDRLIMEDKSTTTKENLQNTFELLGGIENAGNITIVTDGFHQLRARIIAVQLGYQGEIGAVSAQTQWEFVPTYTVREWVGLPYQLVTGLFK